MDLIPPYQNELPVREDDIRQKALKALIYFEVFRYPVRLSELARFASCREAEVGNVLVPLVKNELVKEQDGHYHLGLQKEDIERRLVENRRAVTGTKAARTIGRFIGAFPFVRAVGISGSLSKGVLSKGGDFDYFLITAPGRLWIARSLLILFKKIFLFNNRRFFCVNYFIDTDHLEIEDKNTFTAVEINTLLPVYNEALITEFRSKNLWSNEEAGEAWYKDSMAKTPKNFFIKRLLEKLLSGRIGDGLDSWFMNLTIRRWKKKFSHFDASTLDQSMRSRKYVSKHHPQNFQVKVMKSFEEKTQKYSQLLEGIGV